MEDEGVGDPFDHDVGNVETGVVANECVNIYTNI